MGGHAPARVDGLAIEDGGDGGAAAEMAGDEPEPAGAAQLRAALGDVAMAGAVEAVAAHAVLGFPLVRHGEADIVLRQIIVERGLEGADARQIGMRAMEATDGGDVGGIVRGQQRVDFLHGGEHARVEQLRAGDVARHDGLEPDGGEMAKTAEVLLNQCDGGVVIGEIARAFLLRPGADLDVINGVRCADAFDAAARKEALGRHLEQAELERGAADIGDEDLVVSHGRGRGKRGGAPCLTWRREPVSA